MFRMFQNITSSNTLFFFSIIFLSTCLYFWVHPVLAVAILTFISVLFYLSVTISNAEGHYLLCRQYLMRYAEYEKNRSRARENWKK